MLADGLAAAVAVALPWSTTLTILLIWLYLAALLPRFEVAGLRKAFLEPVSALPAALFVLAALAMLWADVPVRERLQGLSPFRLILLIPFLIMHFRHSANAHWVLVGFLASCTVLLALSWALFVFPDLPWRPRANVPVRDHISQSGEFTICIFALLALAADAWRAQRRRYATSLVALAFVFLANLLYVATARTALVVLPVLLVLFAFRQFGWRGALGLLTVGAALTAIVWTSSPYLRDRVMRIPEELQDYRGNTPAGLRLEFWRRSIELIAEAPLTGHGTGTIPKLFRRDATAETHPATITV